MRLQVRIPIILSVLLALYVVLGLAAIRAFVYPTFSDLEEKQTNSEVDRVHAALASEFKHLALVNAEYANWDASHQFALDSNQAYLAENLSQDYMVNLGLDVMVFFDRADRPIWSGVIVSGELISEDAVEVFESLLPEPSTLLAPTVGSSSSERRKTGLIETTNGILLFVSSPILHSDKSGPSAGKLMVGSFLSDDKLTEISNSTGVPVQFRTTDYLLSQQHGKQLATRFIHAHSDEIHSYLPLDDLSNRTLGYVEVRTSRSVMQAGMNTIYAMAASLLFVGTIILLAIWLSIKHHIANPIVELGEHIDSIRRDDDLDRKLNLGREDEIGMLAKNFDALTDALRESRDELLAARDNAVQLAQHKSDFLATMSHEIRTPLNGVLGMTELLLSTDLDGRQRRFAHTANRSGELLLSVINDILDFSKIDSGNLILENAELDIRDVIEDVGAIFAPAAQQKNVELLCATNPPDLHSRYRGDAVRLRQILSNLVSNAVKFTEAGEITLTASSIDAPSAGGIRFAVTDTGVGIEPAALDAIFESFGQADRSTTRRFGGTGLGLTIAQRLANLMGGEISVTSEPGVGTTFTLELNLEWCDAAGPTGRTGTLQDISGSRILVVDDNATNRDILRHQLTSWKMEEHCTSSASEALSAIDSARASGRPFDLAILDLHMPDVNGAELALKIRESAAHNDLKMLMLSSVDLSYQQQESLQPVISSFLTKPVRQSMLFDAVSVALAGDNVAYTGTATLAVESPPCRKILLAEDNEVNREVACAMLRHLNCSIDIATDGAMAAELAKNGNYDLVLMDCNMPGVDGFEATRRIRLEASGRTLPIIALTANALEGDRERCLAAGMDDYISKPFVVAQLKEVLQQWSHKEPIAPTPIANNSANDSECDVIEPKAIAAIRGMQREGQPDLFAKLVDIYLDSSAEDVRKLQDGVSAQDVEQIRHAAHSLKSSSANLGARDLAALCNILETKARNGELVSANDQVADISSEHSRVLSALRAETETG